MMGPEDDLEMFRLIPNCYSPHLPEAESESRYDYSYAAIDLPGFV